MSKTVSALVLMVLAALLSGCAVRAGYRVDGPQPYYSSRGYGYEHRHPGLVVPPCEPYQADELMEWATELESNQSHLRRAEVKVLGGRADCKTYEKASSDSQQKFKRPEKPRVSAPPQSATGEKR